MFLEVEASVPELEPVEVKDSLSYQYSTKLTAKAKRIQFNYTDPEIQQDQQQKVEVFFPPLSTLGTMTVNFELKLLPMDQCMTPILYISPAKHVQFLRKVKVTLPWRSLSKTQLLKAGSFAVECKDFRRDIFSNENGIIVSSFSFSPVGVIAETEQASPSTKNDENARKKAVRFSNTIS